MLRSSSVIGTLVLAVLGVQAVAGPNAINHALRRADRAAASATATWTKFDRTGEAYAKALDAVHQSGVFDTPITLFVTDISLKTDDKTGVIVLEGVCKERVQELAEYLSEDEHQYKKNFDAYTKQIQTDYDIEMQTLTSSGAARTGSQQAGGRVVGSRQRDPQETAAYIAELTRRYEANMAIRLHGRKLLFGDLDVLAESRRKKLSPLMIHATISAELAASRKLKKLAFTKSAALTLEVQSFELQAGNKEINRPVSVASLTGTIVDVSPTRSSMKKMGSGRLPKRAAPKETGTSKPR